MVITQGVWGLSKLKATLNVQFYSEKKTCITIGAWISHDSCCTFEFFWGGEGYGRENESVSGVTSSITQCCTSLMISLLIVGFPTIPLQLLFEVAASQRVSSVCRPIQNWDVLSFQELCTHHAASKKNLDLLFKLMKNVCKNKNIVLYSLFGVVELCASQVVLQFFCSALLQHDQWIINNPQ